LNKIYVVKIILIKLWFVWGVVGVFFLWFVQQTLLERRMKYLLRVFSRTRWIVRRS